MIDARRAPGIDATQGRLQPRQGPRQGRPQDDVEDGHLDGRVVHRRAGLRSDRAVTGTRRHVLHRHGEPARRHRARRMAREIAARHAIALPEATDHPRASRARGRRPLPVASRGRTSPVQPRHRCAPAAGGARRELRQVQGVHKAVDEQACKLATLRGLFRFRDGVRAPVPIEEVEPVEVDRETVRDRRDALRLDLAEAHETLAIAMNRIGGRSNSGEGGEDAERDRLDQNGDSRRSRIRQVASARFGVTIEYLATPTICRSRSRRAPSPARAVSSRATRCIPGSRRRGSQRRAWA